MLTNTKRIRRFSGLSSLPLPPPPLLLLLLTLLASFGDGASVTWGQVNKYASPLYTQDVYLARGAGTNVNTDEDADAAAAAAADVEADVTDVVFGSQNSSGLADAYTITAVHAYDLTPPSELGGNGGNGGVARLISGGVGQQHATVRFQRLKAVAQLSVVHFQLVIYGIDL